MIGTIIVVVLVLIIAIWFISVSNSFNRHIVKIKEADSGIDVALTKRYDVLTKLLDTVKGYTKYEKETVIETIKVRQGMSITEKNEADEKMNAVFSDLKAIVENYPDLKASSVYVELQKSIADVEEHLQAARRMFNANVSALNQMVVTFPNSIVAGMKGIKEYEFFKADETKKEDVKIDL